MLAPETVAGIEAVELSGNFEIDYIECCKKLGIKPLHIVKFGTSLPPLPLKQNVLNSYLSPNESVVSMSSLAGRSSAADRSKASNNISIMVPADDDNNAQYISNPDTNNVVSYQQGAQKIPIPTRKILSDRRETLIQEFLKKAQVDYEGGLLIQTPFIPNHVPYTSRFKYTPTIDLEHADGEEGEGETLYKIQMRNFRIAIQNFEILHRVSHNTPNLVNLTFWNCGLNDQHFHLISNIISSGNITQLHIDCNPSILESNYCSLLGEESLLRIVSFRGNQITDNGVRMMAVMLKSNHSLLSLDLFDNKIQKNGADALSDVLKTNTTLQSLNLGKNHIGDEGLIHISKTLLNIQLSPEEVQQRKKLMILEADKSKVEAPAEDDPKKKGGLQKRSGSSSLLKPNDKDKKGGKAALPAPKKGDPVPPKGSKPAEDPKTKKIAANAADDKKGPKKGALPPAKGKKGKDEKDETDDVFDSPVVVDPMFEINNQWFVLGNRTLNNLNVSHNGITEAGLKTLFDAVTEQELTAENANDGLLGLFRANLYFNSFPVDSTCLLKLQSLLNSRNPFHEISLDGDSDEDDEGEEGDGAALE